MKLSKARIKKLLKEEIQKLHDEESLDEGSPGYGLPDPEVHMLKAQFENLKAEIEMIKQHLITHTTHCKCIPKD